MISASAGDYAKNIKLTNPSKPKADYSEVYRKYGEETSNPVANLGKKYNRVGTVVAESPVEKITGFSQQNPYHYIDQKVTRAVSSETVLNTFKNPKVIVEQWGGQRYLYLTDAAAVVVNKSGELVTTYGKDTFGNTTLQILEEAIK
jgi:hypothetical protein